MRNLIQNWEWDDTWISLVLAGLITTVIFTFIALLADHSIRYYYLSGSGTNTNIIIKGDINWADDITLQLDRNISYTEAIEMVEKLNKTLNNK